MAKFNVGQRVTAVNTAGRATTGTIQRLYGAHQVRADDTGIVADVLFDDGPTVMGMPLAKLFRLDKTVTSTPNLGSQGTDSDPKVVELLAAARDFAAASTAWCNNGDMYADPHLDEVNQAAQKRLFRAANDLYPEA